MHCEPLDGFWSLRRHVACDLEEGAALLADILHGDHIDRHGEAKECGGIVLVDILDDFQILRKSLVDMEGGLCE